jgi:hypothetical protein
LTLFDRSFDHSFDRSYDHSFDHSFHHSFDHPFGHSFGRSFDAPFGSFDHYLTTIRPFFDQLTSLTAPLTRYGCTLEDLAVAAAEQVI